MEFREFFYFIFSPEFTAHSGRHAITPPRRTSNFRLGGIKSETNKCTSSLNERDSRCIPSERPSTIYLFITRAYATRGQNRLRVSVFGYYHAPSKKFYYCAAVPPTGPGRYSRSRASRPTCATKVSMRGAVQTNYVAHS